VTGDRYEAGLADAPTPFVAREGPGWGLETEAFAETELEDEDFGRDESESEAEEPWLGAAESAEMELEGLGEGESEVAEFEDLGEQLEQEEEDLNVVGRIRAAVAAGTWSVALRLAIAGGQRDENALTNLVFRTRHPELGGRPIRSDERTLAAEWVTIRDMLIRPALRAQPSGRPATGTASGTGRMSTQALRQAWASARCNEAEMVTLDFLGRRTPVNRLTRDAFAALARALDGTGYRASSAWCYNCRKIRNSENYSLHAYGLAMDIDPSCNPHRVGYRAPARFSARATQSERCADVRANRADTNFTPEQIAAAGDIRTVDGLRVFSWGGHWRRSPDAMHFQIDVTPAELARGLAHSAGAPGSAFRPIPLEWEAANGSVPEPFRGGPSGELGTLVVDAAGLRPFRYRFTAEDALWTAKLVQLEAGGDDDANSAAVLWAMLNRYALFTHRKFSTFTKFIRAYSTTLQPVLVNPQAAARHAGKPHFVPSDGYYPGTAIPRGQTRRHLATQKQPWEALKASARALTLRGLRGELPNPGIGNASEFASTRVLWMQRNKTRVEPSAEQWRAYTQAFAKRKKSVWIGEVPGLNQRRNAFFVKRLASGYPPNAVRVVSPASTVQRREYESGESFADEVFAHDDEAQFAAASDGEVPAPVWLAEAMADAYEADEEWALEQGATTAAGRLEVEHLPLLASHRGTRPDLVLRWNAMTNPSVIDVVVHFHGYSGDRQRMRLPTSKESRSGLDLAAPPSGGPNRERPTLAILPRGNYFGGRSGIGYNFPALTGAGALRALIREAMERFAAETGVRAPMGRLILTAHSGGGAPIMAILRHEDPDEVHTFDALYGNPDALIAWARKRIERDLAQGSAGGALRVIYRSGEPTDGNSLKVRRALCPMLTRAANPAVSARYRVERTGVGHNDVPARFGGALLADAGADVSGLVKHVCLPASRREAESWEEAEVEEWDGEEDSTQMSMPYTHKAEWEQEEEWEGVDWLPPRRPDVASEAQDEFAEDEAWLNEAALEAAELAPGGAESPSEEAWSEGALSEGWYEQPAAAADELETWGYDASSEAMQAVETEDEQWTEKEWEWETGAPAAESGESDAEDEAWETSAVAVAEADEEWEWETGAPAAESGESDAEDEAWETSAVAVAEAEEEWQGAGDEAEQFGVDESTMYEDPAHVQRRPSSRTANRSAGTVQLERFRACTSGPTPGALAMQRQWLRLTGRRSGIHNCRKTEFNNPSLHGEGRAIDLAANAGNPQQKRQADAYVEWLVANAVQIQCATIIWNARIWSWAHRAAGWRPYGGKNKHTDHIHVNLTWEGALEPSPLLDGPVPGLAGGASPPAPAPRPKPTPPTPQRKRGGVPANVVAFYRTYVDHARRSQEATGVPILVTLGQAAVESGWGKHAPRFNFFGIKARATDPEASRQLLRTKEVLKRPDVRSFPEVISVTARPDGKFDYVVRDWFRAYPSATEAFLSHGRLIRNGKRYAGAWAHVNDPYVFIQAVARAGYATGPSYAQSVSGAMRLLERAAAASQ
jgi:hypothetical protein